MTPTELEQQSGALAKPYRITRSRLGVTSKVFSESFLCTLTKLHTLHESISEKLYSLSPEAAGFQYLISFDDRTHVDHDNLEHLETLVERTNKVTERLVLRWNVTHTIDGEDNEVTVAVRISNPVNPLLMLQAALSKSPEDIDNFEFENGSVAVSVDGTDQRFAQEVFEEVGRWINSCPKPESITRANEVLSDNKRIIQLSNYWIFPLFVAIAYFLVLWKQESTQTVIALTFIGIVGHSYLRHVAGAVNEKINKWVKKSHMLSLFDLTGGDSNKQNRLAVKASKSTGKLVAAAIGSLLLNVAGGLAVASIVIWIE